MIAGMAWYLAWAGLALSGGDPYEAVVLPFLARHCTECHSGPEAKGDLALDAFPDARSTDGRAGTWLDVRDRLASGEMPPHERDRPEPDAVAAVVAWIDARFATEVAADPGRPTLRRLNRAEYANTIRDLFGVDFDAAGEFPVDDAGHGFDNVGDALSLPDMLLDKYVAAAERVAALAVADPDDAEPRRRRVPGADLEGKGSGMRGKARGLASNGEVGVEFDFPRAGEYVVRARTYGDQAGDDVVRIALKLGREEKGRFEVPATAAKPQEDELRLRVDAGRRRVAVAFLNDYYAPKDPDPKNRDRNLAVEWIEVVGPVDPPAHSAFQRLELEPRTRGSLRDVIARLLRRAWRRPPEAREVDRVVALVQREPTFEAAVRLAVQAALVSPHFLFLVEREPDGAAAGAARRLNAHELAARLSYALWSTMPDDALSRVADDGSLLGDEVLHAQVRRMLRDPRASALARNFGAQWLQTRNLDRFVPDPARFPAFDAELAASMRTEAELFFDAVLREGRGVRELIDADFTFVDERLARHYGLPGVHGPEMRRVPVDRAVRGGVLGMAAVLAVTSNPTRTSPVKRGKWILDNLLGAPTPPPPPGVGVIDEAPAAVRAASLRERLEEHRKNTECAACHARLDPLGFGLENYDATGAWRSTEEGHAVSARGTLPDGRSFEGLAGLKSILGQGDAFVRCFTEKLATYALGRGLTRRDRAATEAIVAGLGRDPAVEDVVWAIVRSDAFRRRGVEHPGDAASTRAEEQARDER